MQTLRLLSLVTALSALVLPSAASAAPPTAARIPVHAQMQTALDALQLLLSAYAAGNLQQIESLVEPTMLGYSRIVDPVRDAALAQKQLRINLSDTRTQVSDDVVIIQTHWEKRYLAAPARQAGRKAGNSTFVMRPDAAMWRLSALSGDNPFAME